MNMVSRPQYFKPVYGVHPHGGHKALVHFQDRYFRPCPEEKAARAVYVEYDINGVPIHVEVLFGAN
ncbi:MAG: hypothetical protein PUD85_08515 [Bacteroidales bacterium]|nr:hypothetical protein [Bacteroidales bacterium]MDD6773964.1 hypothetical protein [Bacteroidales bacterium]